jgi:hypothetical protein
MLDDIFERETCVGEKVDEALEDAVHHEVLHERVLRHVVHARADDEQQLQAQLLHARGIVADQKPAKNLLRSASGISVINFGEKDGIFLENQCYDTFFWPNSSM